MRMVYLDVIDKGITSRHFEVDDIAQILPSPLGGCIVGLRSVGVVKVSQSAETISQSMLSAVRDRMKE